MKFLSNKIIDIKKTFVSELSGIYDIKEIESFLFLLLEEYAKIPKVEAILDPQKTLNESTLLQFSSALRKLNKNQPIQYILGKTNFYDLDFIVTPDVLIPRPETEELMDLIIKQNRNIQNLNILDIGCGSGCIAITLKKNLVSANVFALDNFENALSIAKLNALKNETEINFSQHDILKAEDNFPFPKFINSYLKDKNVSLNLF